MARIKLEQMEFYAFHGVLEHEKQYGNTFLVTLEMEVDTLKAEKSDQLNDTVNYAAIYRLVDREMQQRSNLLENIARRIAENTLLEFPGVLSLQLDIAKLTPPLSGKVARVGVSLQLSRNEL